jgi:hypothetical protein
MILATLLCTSCALSKPSAPAHPGIEGGAPSMDALMAKFVQALSNKDTDQLGKLRLSKAEYLDVIVPGTVEIGQPPRQVSEEPKEYFWGRLDAKSHFFADNLMENFGGRPYRGYELSFSKPVQEYAWYKAYGPVRLELQGEDNTTYHLMTGWVAEVDGKYKFIGYEYDD